VVATLWDWTAPVAIATVACGFWGGLWSRDPKDESLWATIKAR
jgi:hypothetical protein